MTEDPNFRISEDRWIVVFRDDDTLQFVALIEYRDLRYEIEVPGQYDDPEKAVRAARRLANRLENRV